MSQPVWTLSVDLQTKTATFQSGLADAARSARGAFGEIRSGAGEMAVGVSKGSIDVRHSLGLVDNVIRGAHAQAMADLVRMYAQSALVMTALPIAAAAAGLALIGGIAYEAAEHVKNLKDAEEKLNDDLMKAGTVGNMAFRRIDEDILKTQQRVDDLRNDHLGALLIQLKLIDMQSMDQLVKNFEGVQRAAAAVFKNLKGSWMTLDTGAAGANHALTEFGNKYASLLALGRDKEASDLLHGTLQSAKEVLQYQQQASGMSVRGMLGSPLSSLALQIALHREGLSLSHDDIAAQQQLVATLEQQVGLEARLNSQKTEDKKAATLSYDNGVSSRRSAAVKEAAESQVSMAQSAIAADKTTADAQLTIHHASLEERLKSDLDFAAREYQVKEAANKVEIAALNKSGNDYANQLKALNDKALELQQQYITQVAELKAHAAVAINQRDVQALEQGIREQIDATRQGSAARLAAINAGIREEEARQMQATQFYRDLCGQRVQVMRQMGEEQRKQQAEAGGESADNDRKMQELSLTGFRQHLALSDSGHQVSGNTRANQAKQVADKEYQIQMQYLQKKVEALDKSGNDYENKLKALQDKETQLTQQHENEITQIKDKATEDRNKKILTAEQNYENDIAQSLTSILMRHQTVAQAMTALGNQVVSSLMQSAMKHIEANLLTKESDAATAARKMFVAGMDLPFPANIVAAPVLAAGAFASVMAFAGGTDSVPGVGRGDIVPAMLTPGEGVVPGGVMDGLRSMALNGGFKQGQIVHIHASFAPKVHAMDADGVDRVLTKHQSIFKDHMARAVRKANHSY